MGSGSLRATRRTLAQNVIAPVGDQNPRHGWIKRLHVAILQHRRASWYHGPMVPFSTWFFGGAGALFLLRGLWNPQRAVLQTGGVESCPGPEGSGCQDTIALSSAPGTSVYAVGSGTVVLVGDRFVHVQLSNEPVIVHYFGLSPDVAVGQYVNRGRKIGVTRDDGPLEFGVTGLVPAANGAALASVEPASWLAARGFKLSVKTLSAGADAWCAQGRHIMVPKPVHQQCGLLGPSKSSFALLPVTIAEQ